MNAYNGFSGAQRGKASAWLLKMYRSGQIERPAECCACGQREGVLHHHAEDYSEPFGPHLTAYPICIRCHMKLHRRHKDPVAWKLYCDEIEQASGNNILREMLREP